MEIEGRSTFLFSLSLVARIKMWRPIDYKEPTVLFCFCREIVLKLQVFTHSSRFLAHLFKKEQILLSGVPLIIPFIGLVHCHFLQSQFLQILSHSTDVKHQHDLLNYWNYLCLPPLFYRKRVYQNNLSRDLSRRQGKMLANWSRRNDKESEQDNWSLGICL